MLVYCWFAQPNQDFIKLQNDFKPRNEYFRSALIDTPLPLSVNGRLRVIPPKIDANV